MLSVHKGVRVSSSPSRACSAVRDSDKKITGNAGRQAWGPKRTCRDKEPRGFQREMRPALSSKAEQNEQ